MRILIMTVGSRGDVQPFVALGRGLKAAGHAVTISAPALFGDFVKQHGLTFAPINDDLLKLKDSPQLAMDNIGGGGGKLALLKMIKPLLRKMLDDEWQAAQAGFDSLIYHPKTLGGIHIAEKLGIPAFLSLPVPLYTPTSGFTYPLLPQINLGGWFNRLTYRLTNLITMPYAGMINAWRRDTVGMAKRPHLSDLVRADTGQPTPVLYAYSQHIVPRPADFPPHVYTPGFWFLDEQQDASTAWQPPADLLRFLAAGTAPVYVGFGSMTSRDPQEKARTVIAALKQAGQRGILASGWGGLKPGDVPDHCYVVQEAPHEWLFPRVAAVVHHGGAGTTAAGLRAGKPALVAPFFGDQQFWGTRLHALGIAAAPIPQKKLTVDRLTAALQQITSDGQMSCEAERIGALVRAEDGVGRAVQIVTGA